MTVRRGTKRTISDVLVSSLLKSVRGSVTKPSPFDEQVLPAKALDKVCTFNQGDVCIDKERFSFHPLSLS